MTKKHADVIVLLLVLITLSIIGFNIVKLIYVDDKITQWEYGIAAIPDSEFADSMNKMGKEGWELVNARRAIESTDLTNISNGITPKGIYECIFKRPAKREKENKDDGLNWKKP